jgi:hypothetical protein
MRRIVTPLLRLYILVIHEINASMIQIENATSIIRINMNKIMCKLIDIDSGSSIERIKINIQPFRNLYSKLLNFGSYVPKFKIFKKKKKITSEHNFQNGASVFQTLHFCSRNNVFKSYNPNN